ncbi:hypothetical protein [Telluribacter humicola]|uniref:hypothetical protein n=1 Tax=Telluribacter humicola TaxID=1720261 RepID=UPI001A97C172|nr:hypothetical protein [Telluribacter humicola]
MKKVILSILCLAGSYRLAAQEHPNSLKVRVGSLSGRMLDQQASPLLYHTRATQVTLDFLHMSKRARFSVAISPAIGTTLPERFGERAYGDDFYQYKVHSSFYAADVDVSYIRQLGSRSRKVKFFLGGKLQNSLQIADKVANFYWATNVAALQAQFQTEYTHNRHHLTAGVSTPVLAAVSRHIHANFPKSADESNFIAFFKQGTRFTAPHRLRMLQANAHYQFMLSQRMSAGVDYGIRWMRYPSPRPVQSIYQSVSVHTAFNF